MSEKSDKDTSNTSNEDNIIIPVDFSKDQDINIINKQDEVEKMKDNLIDKIEIKNNNQEKIDAPENKNDDQNSKDINKDNNIIENNLNNQNKNDYNKNKDDSTDNSSNKEIEIIKKDEENNNENKLSETGKIKNDNKPEIITKRFKRFFRYKIKTNIEKPKILKEIEDNKINDFKPNIEKKDYNSNNNNIPIKVTTFRNRSSLNVTKSKNAIKVNLNNDFQIYNSNNINIDIESNNCLTENNINKSPAKSKNSSQIKHYCTLTNNNFYSSVNNKNTIRKSNTITKDNNNANKIRKRNIITNYNNNFNNNFVVSINCSKITHHASSKSNGTILIRRDNSKINSNNKEIVENKTKKDQEKINGFIDMGRSLLLDAPKKQCSICHKFIESHLFKIHTNNHPSQIFKWMYLGTFENACNILDLRRLGINYILNCAYDCKNTHLPKCITELHLKVRDESDFEIFEYFEKANAFINQVRSKGGIILIHCKLGISRSPSFVLAYLMKYYNFSFENALKFLRKRRPQVNPNEGFMDYLDKYEKLFKRKERKKIDEANASNK